MSFAMLAQNVSICANDTPKISEKDQRGCLRGWFFRHAHRRAINTDLVSRVVFPALFIAFNALYWTFYYLAANVNDDL